MSDRCKTKTCNCPNNVNGLNSYTEKQWPLGIAFLFNWLHPVYKGRQTQSRMTKVHENTVGYLYHSPSHQDSRTVVEETAERLRESEVREDPSEAYPEPGSTTELMNSQLSRLLA